MIGEFRHLRLLDEAGVLIPVTQMRMKRADEAARRGGARPLLLGLHLPRQRQIGILSEEWHRAKSVELTSADDQDEVVAGPHFRQNQVATNVRVVQAYGSSMGKRAWGAHTFWSDGLPAGRKPKPTPCSPQRLLGNNRKPEIVDWKDCRVAIT